MTEIEDMGDVKPTDVIPDAALYVAMYWLKSTEPVLWPMYSFAHNKNDAIKWASENSHRDPDKPIKLFRLPYGSR
jgi:hypothetical protein